jgi:PadR family transcriptional regulator, regulatory protein PadR
MIPKELAAASSRPLVMSILAQGENYGYAIIQQVLAMSDGEIVWSEGMLYPVLHRLESEGLIASRWKNADTGRKRKYYRLSAAGTRSLAVHRQQWLAVHETLTRLWGQKPCLT